MLKLYYAPRTRSVRVRWPLEVVEKHLSSRAHVLGAEFSAADIMLGFTLLAAELLGVLDARYPATLAYLRRLPQRPAYLRATAD